MSATKVIKPGDLDGNGRIRLAALKCLENQGYPHLQLHRSGQSFPPRHGKVACRFFIIDPHSSGASPGCIDVYVSDVDGEIVGAKPLWVR